MSRTIVVGVFGARCEFRRDACWESLPDSEKRYRRPQFHGSNGDPDIAGVIYGTLQLIHASACLLAWSVSDSIPAGVMASPEAWCLDLASSPPARRGRRAWREFSPNRFRASQ
jgi:hypothetical protein